MWNPAISSVKLKDHNADIPRLLTAYFNWSVWDYKKANCGDRFFLLRVGEGNTGIVMSGVFDSNPYENENWSGRGREVYYMDMLPNLILDPDAFPMITTQQLEETIPSFDWSGGHSGRLLNGNDAMTLEKLWHRYMTEHIDDADGITMNAIQMS